MENQDIPNPFLPPQKRKTFKIFFVLAAIAALIAGATWLFFTLNKILVSDQDTFYPRQTDRGPRPQSTSESNFLLHEIGYECSKKITGTWVEASIGPLQEPGYYFQPSNPEDLKKYCRESYIIEYRAVLDILRQDDVSQTIEKYNSAEAWVKALSHKYIEDKNYLSRILPAYSHLQIDCIIVVHSPDGTRFFIENGERHTSHDDHEYLEVTAAEFLSSLNQAPSEDIHNFWLSLH